MKRVLSIVVALGVVGIAIAILSRPVTAPVTPTPQAATPAAASGGSAPLGGAPAVGVDFPDEMERSIKLPQLTPALAPGPGRGAVAALCTNCHTPRYILMQPPFSRKVWEAEVKKMKNAFGAPVSDAQIPEIVDYLMAIRGK